MNEEIGHDESSVEEASGELVEKTMEERAKEIGRDGAYLEVDAKDLIAAYRSGELAKAKIVVIKSARIELSGGFDVRHLLQVAEAVSKIVDGKTSSAGSFPITKDVVGMDDAQASTCIIMSAVSAGLGYEVGE